MGHYWAYSIDHRAGLQLPGRPVCEGRRWRPLEWLNDCSRPKDMDAYRAQFRTRPAARSGNTGEGQHAAD